MYRAMAIYFMDNGIDCNSEEQIQSAVDGVDIRIEYADGVQQVILNGSNVTARLREEAVGRMASATSGYGCVRAKLLELQRNLAETSNVIMDGRDIADDAVLLDTSDMNIDEVVAAVKKLIR